MALIKCSECSIEVSDKAANCPKCGNPMATQSKPVTKEDYAKYIILGLLLPVVGIIIGIVYMAKPIKEEKKMGESVLCYSILFLILWSIGLSLFNAGVL